MYKKNILSETEINQERERETHTQKRWRVGERLCKSILYRVHVYVIQCGICGATRGFLRPSKSPFFGQHIYISLSLLLSTNRVIWFAARHLPETEESFKTFLMYPVIPSITSRSFRTHISPFAVYQRVRILIDPDGFISERLLFFFLLFSLVLSLSLSFLQGSMYL